MTDITKSKYLDKNGNIKWKIYDVSEKVHEAYLSVIGSSEWMAEVAYDTIDDEVVVLTGHESSRYSYPDTDRYITLLSNISEDGIFDNFGTVTETDTHLIYEGEPYRHDDGSLEDGTYILTKRQAKKLGLDVDDGEKYYAEDKKQAFLSSDDDWYAREVREAETRFELALGVITKEDIGDEIII